jgi:hypothetical protein
LVLHFSDFSMIFSEVLKLLQKTLKVPFTTGSLESFTGNPGKNQIDAIGSLPARGVRRRRSGRRSSPGLGSRFDLRLLGLPWGVAPAWGGADGVASLGRPPWRRLPGDCSVRRPEDGVYGLAEERRD